MVKATHIENHNPSSVHGRLQDFIFRTVVSSLVFGYVGASFADSASVYLAYDAQGVPRFSNQAYDVTYHLFLSAETLAPVKKGIISKNYLQKRIAAQKEITQQTRIAAHKYGLEPALIHALIDQESGGNMNAVSRKGAIGAMQLLPATAKRYGAHAPSITAQNIDAGTHYLRDLLRQFDGNLALTLAAYNAGEGSVSRYGNNIPPFRETMLYVPAVLTKYEEYKSVMTGQD